MNLTAKELKLKYRNSALGFIWSFINPLLMLFIYTFAFKTILKVAIPNFPVFLLCGLLPWTFFQNSALGSTMSIISGAGLIKKVYFAREVIPLSQVLANFVNFLITLVVLLLAAFLVFQLRVSWALLILPLVLFLLLIFTTGLSLALSALNIKYRDISHFAEVFFMFFFYLTPIIYSFEMLPEKYRIWFYLNPMTSYVLAIREIILEGRLPSINNLLAILGWSVLFLWAGMRIFASREPRFAEDV